MPYTAFPHFSPTMEAKCDRNGFKREFRWSEEGCELRDRYNLRKRLKAQADSSMKNWTPILPRTETKNNVEEKVHNTDSKWDEQGKIHRKGEEKNIFDYEESESSDEEDGITVAELKKTEGWKMLMEALDAKVEKYKLSTK